MVHQERSGSSELIELKNLFLILFTLAIGFALFSSGVLAQGTALSIDDAELTEGDTVTLYLTLDEAIDGLGRLDASIVSGDPETVALKTISPEAVSDQFLQVDTESAEKLKFKLVDLGNNIDPGDQDVQLVSFEVKGLKGGEVELTVEGIKYTDENGNVIEPNVDPSTVTVLASKPEEEKQAPSDGGEEPTKKETKPEEEKKPEETKPKEEKKPEEEAPKEETPPEADQAYTPEMEGIELRLGQTGEVTLSIASLPDGFRLAETTIISNGVKVDKIIGGDSLYYEVVGSSEESIHFRVGDFDGEVEPGTSELELAEVQLKAVRVGWASLRARTVIQTDKGEKVVRTTEVTDINVFQPTILGTDKPPQDLGGDGLYEDVDGDGELTKKDVFALASNLNSGSEGISAPMFSVFDFNEDGVVNFEDAVKLMRMVEDKE
jgi:PKD repeat protein